MWNGYRATKRRSTVGGPPKFKIVLLGETGVGKSSLFMRLKDDVFGPGIQPTVGIESCSKLVEVDGDQIVVSVPDIIGLLFCLYTCYTFLLIMHEKKIPRPV